VPEVCLEVDAWTQESSSKQIATAEEFRQLIHSETPIVIRRLAQTRFGRTYLVKFSNGVYAAWKPRPREPTMERSRRVVLLEKNLQNLSVIMQTAAVPFTEVKDYPDLKYADGCSNEFTEGIISLFIEGLDFSNVRSMSWDTWARIKRCLDQLPSDQVLLAALFDFIFKQTGRIEASAMTYEFGAGEVPRNSMLSKDGQILLYDNSEVAIFDDKEDIQSWYYIYGRNQQLAPETLNRLRLIVDNPKSFGFEQAIKTLGEDWYGRSWNLYWLNRKLKDRVLTRMKVVAQAGLIPL